ncbi:MAG: phenylacetate--CoA ligase [Clostridia bacterium]|nr:phenylacetate--CoA ligase [Clostridia bacterium]
MHQIQSQRLIKTVDHVYRNMIPYRKKMDAMGVLPGDIKSIDDLCKLPFTDKEDLAQNYPYGLFAVPMDDVVRIHASSGTTGRQKVVGYTREDLEVWGNVMARTFTAGGVTKSDIGHISYGYGLFTGGLGAHGGSETVGCTTVPVSVGNTKRQIQILQDFGCTFICCTPSYALYIAETLEAEGIDPSTLSLRTGFLGAEPWTENMRREIEKRLGITTRDIYGLSEIIGPGVSFECSEQSGLHVNEDHFVPEIVNPDTGEPLPVGTAGELVFTCITKKAFPLIRYRTHDVCRLSAEPCSCGRTLIKMSKPAGRTDDMLIIRGVNVFPSQIESVLLEFDQTAPYYMLIVDRQGVLDTLEIQVELASEKFSDSVKDLEALSRDIRRNIESTLGIAAKVTLVEPHTLPRSEGKAKRILDKRSI